MQVPAILEKREKQVPIPLSSNDNPEVLPQVLGEWGLFVY
jgi:hypothetical protein